METLKMNYNHWINRLYRLVYGLDRETMPTDTCSLAWGYIFLLPCLILYAPVYIRETVIRKKFENTNKLIRLFFSFMLTFVTTVVYVLFFMVGNDVLIKHFNHTYTHLYPVTINHLYNPLAGLGAAIIIILIIALIITVVVGVVEGFKFIGKKLFYKTYKEEKKSFIGTWIQNKKEKSCSKIKWE